MRLPCPIVLLFVFVVASTAQQVRPLPSSKIYGELVKLNTMTSVLYVAAHPDDENTRLLSWLATGHHIRTGYLSLTRGDGGQNILGSEQGAALGLIRTYELLEARKLDGAEQFFARAVDFGFSKNSEETFTQWDRVELIGDAVRVMREFQPDVVICRFPKDSMAGHGQHAASAIVAEDAVRYCRGELDLPKADLERIERIASTNVMTETQRAWKPSRFLFNAYRFGSRSTVREGMFKLDVGQYDPLIGMGYGELAGISRSIHRSQGAGTPSTPGVQPEFFATLAGTPPTQSLFDGIDTTWARVGRADIGVDLNKVIEAFDMQRPDKSVDALLKIRKQINTLTDEHWRNIKLNEIDRIILSCVGFTSDASVNVAMLSVGSDDSTMVTVRTTVRAHRPVPVLLYANVHNVKHQQSSASDASVPYVVEHTCAHDSLVVAQFNMHNADLAYFGTTQPYWLQEGIHNALFTNGGMWPYRKTPNTIVMGVVIKSDTLWTTIPISFKKLEPLRGDVIEELRIVPKVSVEPVAPVVVGTRSGTNVVVRLRAFANINNASLVIRNGATIVQRDDGIAMRAQTDTLITARVNVNQTTTLTAGIQVDNAIFESQVKAITYDHLPTLQYLEPAQIKIVVDPVTFTAKRIAFISGAGEYAPEFLRSMGLTVDEISDEQILNTSELLTYDAVLMGIRAINTRKSMKYLMPSLMQYVESGGTLVMQYNTLQDMSTKELGPYPLPLANKRVTEERAAITILQPQHRLFTTPNTITAADFEGWVQERGLYFPYEYDARYEALLSVHDTNEAPLTGSLLYAKHGKGHYVYCALSLFRQLPAGVTGGMRLFANMLSLGR